MATVTLLPFSIYSIKAAGAGTPVSVTVLTALLVCLIPTTIGGLLSAIGIAGMDRMIQANVIATSGRAVEAAGDVDVLLLDKTGTITLGNRQATQFLPAQGVKEKEMADAAQLSSLADETPEGRSIVVLAKERFRLRERDIHALGASFVPFTAQTPHERRRPRQSTDPKGRLRCRRGVRGQPGWRFSARRAHHGGGHRHLGRHAPGGGGRLPRPGSDSPQRHRQGRYPASASPSCAKWESRR